jgi:DNA-binding transcriptional ArsR family regulator
MSVVQHDPVIDVSAIASAIGEPPRARILFCLVDGRARTSTELSVVAGVSPSTTSVHLERLKTARLVNVRVQGKHRFYSLAGTEVAAVLEGLTVVAGGARSAVAPAAPNRLRLARTCYDHIAGMLGVSFHDRLKSLGWLSMDSTKARAYDITSEGTKALQGLGVDVEAARALRRRFACACLDWSERRPHIGGAIGAELLALALRRRWVFQELDSRALTVTHLGRLEMRSRIGIQL